MKLPRAGEVLFLAVAAGGSVLAFKGVEAMADAREDTSCLAVNELVGEIYPCDSPVEEGLVALSGLGITLGGLAVSTRFVDRD